VLGLKANAFVQQQGPRIQSRRRNNGITVINERPDCAMAVFFLAVLILMLPT
jgi:hypothetical protein